MSAPEAPVRYELTVEAHHRLGETAILDEDSRVELIGGDLIQKPAIGTCHADVLLVVEVSDSTLAYDRGTKLRLYARAGVPEYRIVDVDSRRILQYRDPCEEGYCSCIEDALVCEPRLLSGVRISREVLLG